MGAQYFCETTSDFSDPNFAFSHLVERAQYENGHGGYSGSIAEKRKCECLTSTSKVFASRDEAYVFIENANDERIEDKWGPALYVKYLANDGRISFMFFGYASC